MAKWRNALRPVDFVLAQDGSTDFAFVNLSCSGR
jgi:hypothetical protein